MTLSDLSSTVHVVLYTCGLLTLNCEEYYWDSPRGVAYAIALRLAKSKCG